MSPVDSRAIVGRAAELAELTAGLDAALASRGRVFLFSGEPGIGKTRLCDELCALAASRGAPVLFGRAWESGGAPAYFPWLDVLSALAASLDDVSLRAALGDGAAAVGDVVPEVRARLSTPASVAGSADEARFRLFRGVSSLVRRAARERGLVVVLEDLHAADESSLSLLQFVARELRSQRVLVVGTFRDVEARSSVEVAEALGRLTRDATTLSLARLGPDEAAEFVRRQGRALPEGVVRTILARSQGNPLFLGELCRLVSAESTLDVAALPLGVAAVIRGRLAVVSTATRETLEAAAVAGDESDAAFVAEIAETPVDLASASFANAVRAGILVQRSGARHRFSHALLREVLVHDLARERRASLHGRVARALERRAAFGDAPPLSELAHHLLEGPPEGLEAAVSYAIAAADRAVALAAFEEAVALLERAQLAAREASPKLLAEVRIALGCTRIRRGQGAAGQALCLEAAETARKLGDSELLARAALAYGLEITAALVNPTLVALLEESLAALPEGDSALRARVTARLAAALQPHPDLTYPIGLARKAIEAARRLSDPASLLDALYTGMSAMMDIVDPRERLPLNLEIEQLASSARDTERGLRTQVRLVFDHMELGDFAAADARIDAFERLARGASADRYLWRVPLFRSMRALIHGRFQEAQERWEEARTSALAVADPQYERCGVFHHEGILRAWERHEDMVLYDPEARHMRSALYSGPHWQNGGSAFTLARMEDEEKTRLYLSLVPDDDWPLVRNPPAFFHLGEPLALVGAEAPVRRVYELLLPSEGNAISWGYTCFLWEGAASRVLGLLAARLGEWEAAHRHFDGALAYHEERDAGPLLARTRYEYGRALLQEGNPSLRVRARALLDSAGSEAARLGMTGLVRLVDRRLRETPSGRLQPKAEDAPVPISKSSVSFVREGEYWTVASGSETIRLRDSLGLSYLARLASTPDQPVHVLELSSGGRSEGEPEIVDRGDAGEFLDQEARQSYRARLQDLREELAEAESFGDAHRVEKARVEIEFLAAELSRAVGLGGRARRAGSAAERARSAVQRRIKNAIDRIREASPVLGEQVEKHVRTGNFCVFSLK